MPILLTTLSLAQSVNRFRCTNRSNSYLVVKAAPIALVTMCIVLKHVPPKLPTSPTYMPRCQLLASVFHAQSHPFMALGSHQMVGAPGRSCLDSQPPYVTSRRSWMLLLDFIKR